ASAAWIIMFDRGRSNVATFAAGVAVVWMTSISLLSAGFIRPASNTAANALLSVQGNSPELRMGLVCPRAPIRFLLGSTNEPQMQHPWRGYADFALQHPAKYLEQRLAAFVALWSPYVPDWDLYPRHLPAQGFRCLHTLLFVLSVWLGGAALKRPALRPP